MSLLLKKACLFVMILLFSCGDERSNVFGFDTRLKVLNTQKEDYYYCISTDFPNLKIVESASSQRFQIVSNNTDIFKIQCCWEELLIDCCESHLIFNFFTKENYENNDWETIRDQNLIDTQMIFTIDQLDSLDWLVKL